MEAALPLNSAYAQQTAARVTGQPELSGRAAKNLKGVTLSRMSRGRLAWSRAPDAVTRARLIIVRPGD